MSVKFRIPFKRIEKTIQNDMADYMGADVFEGGCFLFNSLVELSGQSSAMSRQILRGFVRFSRLLRSWLEEAERKGLIKEGLNLKEIANFIVISLNGAGALYSASRDPNIWKQTVQQLRFYIHQLSK
jgi:TetR/AcrR family transcriptional repressor of nem operon